MDDGGKRRKGERERRTNQQRGDGVAGKNDGGDDDGDAGAFGLHLKLGANEKHVDREMQNVSDTTGFTRQTFLFVNLK